MAKCPKCERETDHLETVQTGVQSANLYLSNKEIPPELAKIMRELKTAAIEYSDIEFEGDGGVMDYKCPFCHETLFGSEDDAVEFLAGIKSD